MTDKQLEDKVLNNIIAINRIWYGLREMMYMTVNPNLYSEIRNREAKMEFGKGIIELKRLK